MLFKVVLLKYSISVIVFLSNSIVRLPILCVNADPDPFSTPNSFKINDAAGGVPISISYSDFRALFLSYFFISTNPVLS